MSCTGIRFIFMVFLTLTVVFRGKSQNVMPETFLNGNVRDQMDYVQEKTRIYEGYRAIREDMFQMLKKNTIDSLQKAKRDINNLTRLSADLNLSIDSLNKSLETVKLDLDLMTRSKNSISLLGIDVNKSTYNAVMWILIIGLAGILVIGYLAFKRNYNVTVNTKKEFEELNKEFEAYRKASREAREKMSMSHFNELKKMRGG